MILARPACAQHAARWLVRSDTLDQFKVAAEIAVEGVEGYRPFEDAMMW